MRSALVAALVACADSPFKAQARRFLGGLAFDELQYIAAFLGASILQSAGAAPPGQLPGGSDDRELKMIVLQEYLDCARVRRPALPAGLERS